MHDLCYMCRCLLPRLTCFVLELELVAQPVEESLQMACAGFVACMSAFQLKVPAAFSNKASKEIQTAQLSMLAVSCNLTYRPLRRATMKTIHVACKVSLQAC